MECEVTGQGFVDMCGDSTIKIYTASPLKGGGYLVNYGPRSVQEQVKPLLDKITLPTPPTPTPSVPEPPKTMVKCFDCGTEHEEGKECWICGPLQRARIGAKKIRQEYAIMKRIEREEKGIAK